jgi:hypothetical protein
MLLTMPAGCGGVQEVEGLQAVLYSLVEWNRTMIISIHWLFLSFIDSVGEQSGGNLVANCRILHSNSSKQGGQDFFFMQKAFFKDGSLHAQAYATELKK